jgi:hypothetical protein
MSLVEGLLGHKLCIDTMSTKQLLVCTAFGHPSILQDVDDICVLYSRKSMSYSDSGTAAGCSVQGSLYDFLALGV